jgi:hypothetical protein
VLSHAQRKRNKVRNHSQRYQKGAKTQIPESFHPEREHLLEGKSRTVGKRPRNSLKTIVKTEKSSQT